MALRSAGAQVGGGRRTEDDMVDVTQEVGLTGLNLLPVVRKKSEEEEII